MIRFRPPRVALGFAIGALVADWALGGRLPRLPSTPMWGGLLAACGVAVMLRGWLVFRRAHVAIRPTAETVRLVTDDIYRWTRNPMYLGLVLVMVGLALGTGGVAQYGAAAGFAAVIDRVFCRFEEAKLARAFGDQYLKYRTRVRRWL